MSKDELPFKERDGAWRKMLEAEGFQPYGTRKMAHSARSFRLNALKDGAARVDTIALEIIKLERIAGSAKAELADITGSLTGTIHEELLKDKKVKKQLCVGAVLLLRNVSAILCESFRSSFLQESCFSTHLSIGRLNVVNIFNHKPFAEEERLKLASSCLLSQDLRLSYSEDALRLPPASDIALYLRRAEARRTSSESRRNPRTTLSQSAGFSGGLCKRVSSKSRWRQRRRISGSTLGRRGDLLLRKADAVGKESESKESESKQARLSTPEKSTKASEDSQILLDDDELDKALARFDLEAAIRESQKKAP